MSERVVGRAAAVVFALALVLTPVAGPLVAASTATATTAAPDGMVGLSDAAIQSDVPSGESIPISESEIEGKVFASDHAGTMNVTLTTESHADEVTGKDALSLSGDGMALVISDDTNSEGRTVAIEATVLRNALGYLPTQVYGRHDDGSQWSRPTTFRDGFLMFEIPHFSDNVVTFDSQVEISLDKAVNGSSVGYSLSSTDSVSDFYINVTGVKTTETDTESASGVGTDSSQSIAIGGNLNPTGTVSNEPMINVRAKGVTVESRVTDSSFNGADDVVISGDYAYVAKKKTDSVLVVNITDPSSPSVVGNVTDSTNLASVSSLAVSGSIVSAVGSSGDYLTTIDVSSPSNPIVKGSVTSTDLDFPSEVASAGDFAYVVERTDHFLVVNISDPTAPTIERTITDSTDLDFARDVVVDGSYAYVAARNTDRLTVVDISTPGSATIAGSVSSTSMTDSNSVTVLNSTHIAVGSNDGVSLVDISTPSSPTVRTTTATSGTPDELVVADNYLYSRDQSGRISSINLTTWSEVSVFSSTDVGGRRGFAVSGSRLIAVPGDTNEWFTLSHPGPIDSLSVSDDQGATTTIGHVEPGATTTVGIDLSEDSGSLSWSGSGSALSWTLSYTERTVTENTTVEVNGHSTSQSGTLSAGTTTSLSTNTSWVVDGTNRINVTVGESLSADAPDPKVVVNYTHSAADKQTVTYSSEQWTDRYNASKKFASDRSQASFYIPFGTTVVSIRDLDVRINGSGWSKVSSSEYVLSGNDLTVDLDAVYGGEIPAGTTIEVRTNASKVETYNLTIKVVEPTVEGSKLDSKIRIKSIQSGAWIGVGPTDSGSRVHYLYSESWSSPSDYVIIDDQGNQKLYLPNAVSGGVARVSHLQTKVQVSSGDVRLEVLNPGEDPKISVAPGPSGAGDVVEVTYYNTQTGIEYLLYSVSSEIVRASEVADSPVTLTDDDSNEIWQILDESSGGSDSGSQDPAPAGQLPSDDDSGGIPWTLLGLGGGLLLAVFGIGRLFGGSTGSGVSSGGPLSTVGSGLSALSNRPALLGVIAALGAGGLIATGAISLPSGTLVLILVTGIPLVAYLIQTQIGDFNPIVFGAISLGALLVGLRLIGSNPIELLISNLDQGLIIVAVGILVIVWRLVRNAGKPEEVNRIQIGADDGEN